MPDDADELILKMQHLEAQARKSVEARDARDVAGRLRTKAQRIAFDAQAEVSAAEKALADAQAKEQRAKTPGANVLEAAELLQQSRVEAQDAKGRLVKARARLNFALDQMDEAERAEWTALQAEAHADTHGQIADDPLFKSAPKDPPPER